jgi:DNA-binding transcriptional LysR family regulator
MQIKNWTGLRYLLAIKRGGTIAAAAKLLLVDDTTVSRRLASLTDALGAELVIRQPSGVLALTAFGEQVALGAEKMEHQVDLMAEATGVDQVGCVGLVRLTSVPILINRLLAAQIAGLLDKHPGLEVELFPDARDLSLTLREADVAIRLGRPKTGGSQVKARKIGEVKYAVFVPADCTDDAVRGLRWVSYDASLAHLPQPQWMSTAAAQSHSALSGLRVHDAETALEAVAAGVGRTLLPTFVGGRDGRLRMLTAAADMPVVSREIWLLTHADMVGIGRIAAVSAWAEAVIRSTI